MPRPYSVDLREKVLNKLHEGESPKLVAENFGVSVDFVYDVLARYKQYGHVIPCKVGGHLKPKVTPEGEAKILEWLTERPDLRLVDLCEKYEATFGVKVSKSAMDRALKRMYLSFKKNLLRSAKKQ